MGTLDSMSTITEGKDADILILNDNPLVDIKATQNIYAVINNGQYLDRQALDSILQVVEEKRIGLDQIRN